MTSYGIRVLILIALIVSVPFLLYVKNGLRKIIDVHPGAFIVLFIFIAPIAATVLLIVIYVAARYLYFG